MEIFNDKKHWYDGKMYGFLIDPLSENTRKIISDLIEDGSSIIDIGCGTGSLVFYLSNKCKYVTGVELSKKMIDYANSNKERKNIPNVEFVHCTAEDLSKLTKNRVDYAIFSLSLHEMDPESRMKALLEIKKISNKIIVYDYLGEKNTIKIFPASIVEFFAGKNHFRNYKSFLKAGGLITLLEKNGFKVEEKIIQNKIYAIVKAEKK